MWSSSIAAVSIPRFILSLRRECVLCTDEGHWGGSLHVTDMSRVDFGLLTLQNTVGGLEPTSEMENNPEFSQHYDYEDGTPGLPTWYPIRTWFILCVLISMWLCRHGHLLSSIVLNRFVPSLDCDRQVKNLGFTYSFFLCHTCTTSRKLILDYHNCLPAVLHNSLLSEPERPRTLCKKKKFAETVQNPSMASAWGEWHLRSHTEWGT